MTIKLEINENIPRKDLDVIKKYMINPKDLDKLVELKHFKERIHHLSKNNINETFFTKD